ncbi:MAG: hypothetical protein H8E57_03560 [Candidatus Cloacimonetes bacterium]|nr:hypothetical protein [Candidatus Cloacimonadota bacterium]
MENLENYIDINKRKGFPRIYRFNRFIRWFTLVFGLAAICYAGWLILNKIGADSSKFLKVVPFIIIFFAANSVMKNLFSLNSIKFTNDEIIFRYLARKAKHISWSEITKMQLDDGKHKQIQLVFGEKETEKKYCFTISFPNMLEIVNSIAELCPNIAYDDFIKNVIISEKEKADFQRPEK